MERVAQGGKYAFMANNIGFFPFSRLLLLSVLVLMGLEASAQNNPNIPRAAMGNGLFNQAGTNSCVYCHGQGGVNGKVANAANLQNPKSWKIYKILGGDSAAAANPEDFKAKMKEATAHLIEKGAIVHNSSYKKDWYDVSKAGAPYDGQMLGMTATPSRQWLKKYQEKYKITPDVAAQSLYLYIESLDKSGFFK